MNSIDGVPNFTSPMKAATTDTTGLSAGNRRLGLIVVTFLFFIRGFITVLNDILVPHLKSVRSAISTFIYYGLSGYRDKRSPEIARS